MAVGDGILDANAVRSVRPAKGPPKPTSRDTRRALGSEQRQHLLTFAATHEKSIDRDVVDLVRWLAGTGVRISEALDREWSDVNLVAGTARVRGTKTEHADRVLSLPSWLVVALRDRMDQGVPESGLVFASPLTGRRRDRRNAARALRDLLDDAGFPSATPHSLRRTVASLIDEAGLSIALAADQLGHSNPAMTARVYLGRRGDTARAASVL